MSPSRESIAWIVVPNGCRHSACLAYLFEKGNATTVRFAMKCFS